MRCSNVRWGEDCGVCFNCMQRAHWRRVETKLDAIAQAIEAQRAGTTKIDPVHESAVVADDAPITVMSDQEGA